MAESGLSKPPPSGDHEPAPKPKRFWWRFTLGSLIIVLATSAVTATVILRYVDSIAKALSHNNVLQNKAYQSYVTLNYFNASFARPAAWIEPRNFNIMTKLTW